MLNYMKYVLDKIILNDNEERIILFIYLLRENRFIGYIIIHFLKGCGIISENLSVWTN